MSALNPQLSAVERTEWAISRIEALNPRINAFTHFTFERALSEAKEIDRRKAHGEILGPLAGVPYAVKNLFDIEGLTTLAGSIVNQGNPPAQQEIGRAHV